MADISWAYGICKGAGVDTSKMTPKEVVKKADELQSKNGGAIPKDLADEQERKRFVDTMSGKDYREMKTEDLKEKAQETEEDKLKRTIKEIDELGASGVPGKELYKKMTYSFETSGLEKAIIKGLSDETLNLMFKVSGFDIPNSSRWLWDEVYNEIETRTKQRKETELYNTLSQEEQKSLATLRELGVTNHSALLMAKEYDKQDLEDLISQYKDVLRGELVGKGKYEIDKSDIEYKLKYKKEQHEDWKKRKAIEDKKINALKAKYGAVSISKEQEMREAEAEKYRASFERNRQALRNRLAYSNNGYVEDKKSVRAVKAELEGRFPATEAAKMLGVSAAKIKANLSPSEWHHSGGTMYNRIDYYDISKYIDLADNPDLVFDPDYAEETAIWQKMRGAKGVKD